MLNKILGSIFLISGTSIGAGMLAIPIKLSGISFGASTLIFFVSWILMLISSFAMLEISLWTNTNGNIQSIGSLFFNKNFSIIISTIYILFFYSLIIAYISGSYSILSSSLNHKTKIIYKILFILPFCLINFYGLKIIDNINKLFVLSMLLSYIVLSYYVLNDYDYNKLNKKLHFMNNNLILLALPIMITSFGYNLLIPSLKKYLLNNTKYLITVIIIGSLIPLLIYTIWDYTMSFFLVNLDNKNFIQSFIYLENKTISTSAIIPHNKYITQSIFIFSLTALISSLIGVSLNLYDFIFDLIKITKTTINKCIVLSSVFLLPLVFNIYFSYIFITALTYAAIFASILLIILPIFILWYGRHIKKLEYKYILSNNEYLLFFILFFGIFIILIDLIEKF
ncbi:MAG: hypothetical protein KDH96_08585 [Candidatus Riesia sp.]|nr:hypothetical protein [Candidatus Riesia sp.]